MTETIPPASISNSISAPLWRRFAAIIYDSLIVLSLWMLVGFIALSLFGIEQAQTLQGDRVVLDPVYKNLLFITMLLTLIVFFSWFWMKSGQTLGMQAWKIKIEQADGQPPTIKQCLIRLVLAPFSLGFFAAGYLLMLVNKEKATLHDLLSGTRVIRTYPKKSARS